MNNIYNTSTKIQMSNLILVWNVLTRWYKSFQRFSKLDSWNADRDYTQISTFLRTCRNKELAERIRLCRDASIMPECDTKQVIKLLEKALSLLESKIDNLPQNTFTGDPNYGQAKRYVHVTKELYAERLKFKEGALLRQMDVNILEKRDSKKVRRIVEKRMCQAYFKTHYRSDDNTNRHHINRAVSFQLYNLGQIASDKIGKREASTHWKYDFDKSTGRCIMKQKHGYTNWNEAEKAMLKLQTNHPEDKREIHIYLCKHCGKYHIGHSRIAC